MSTWRLVITGRVGEVPVGQIFHPDASKYDYAAFHFVLEEDQELPRVAPGALVEAHGVVSAGERPLFCAEGVEIRPAGKLQKGGQMLIERGNVIAHPAIIGAHPGWRYVESHSFDDVEAWDRFLRHRLRVALLGLVAVVTMIAVFVGILIYIILSNRHGGGAGGGGAGGAGGTGLGLIAGLLLALRARRALREARALRNSPADPMLMRLWWSVGQGHGPVAIASLGPRTDDIDVMRVPVIGVTEELLTIDDAIPVAVHGRSTETPLIEARGHLLWPAERARHHTVDGWKPIHRRRRTATRSTPPEPAKTH